MEIFNLHIGIPSAVLRPARRAPGALEAEQALLPLQAERNADISGAQCNRCAGLRDSGGDEEPSLWRPGFGGVQQHPGDTVEQECDHVQVTTVSAVES